MLQRATSFVVRHGLSLGAAMCTAAFLAALALQHVFAMQPCPLCVLQRYLLACCVLAFSCATLAREVCPRHPLLRVLPTGVALASAAAGLVAAARHMWIRAWPEPAQSCLPGLDYMLESLPLTRVLPMLFQGTADCSEMHVLWPGLTVPQASAAVFLSALAFSSASLFGLRKRNA